MKISNQHGDVLFVRVDRIHVGAKKLDIQNGYVIEHGEGAHTHVFPEVEGIEVFEDKGEIFVRVSKAARVNHEEHGVQVIEPGIYRKRIEREWDYETQEARKTLD
jgi:hypothetical protein